MSTLGYVSNVSHDFIPFPLVPRLKREDYTELELKHTINAGDKRRANVFRLNVHDQEYIATAALEFREACGVASLNLTTGPLRFGKWRECLEEPFRSEWDDVRQNHPVTVAGFELALMEFLQRYFVPTDYLDQRRYLGQVKKPVQVSVILLASRLLKINKLMSVKNQFNVPYTNMDLKVKFFFNKVAVWLTQVYLYYHPIIYCPLSG